MAIVDRLKKKLLGAGERVSISYEDKDKAKILIIECTVRETHTLSATPTKHQLDDGSIISDHIVNNPLQLELVGINSNTPSELLEIVQSFAVGQAGSLIGGDNISKAAATVGISGILDLAQTEDSGGTVKEKAYKQLQVFHNKKTTCTIITNLEVYSKMAMLEFKHEEDANTAESLNFTVQFEQQRFASSKEIDIKEKKAAPEVEHSADIEEKTGNQGVPVEIQESTATLSAFQTAKKLVGSLF